METLELMKQDVENTTISYRKIAAKYGTNHTQVKKNAEKYGWSITHRVSKKVSNNGTKPQPHKKILGPVALRKIEEIKEELGSNYSPVDEPMIVMYAKNYERYLDLEKKLDEDGILAYSVKTGAEYLSPNFTAAIAIQKSLVTTANQLGLSIASRKKLGLKLDRLDEKQSSIFDFASSINSSESKQDAEGFSLDAI